jgi:acetyl-CoA carboxylase biotin carboxyl carrier protein
MNLKEIFELMDKFDKSTLTEIKVSSAEGGLTLKKGGETPVFHPGSFAMPAYNSAPALPAAAANASAPLVAAPKVGVEILTSPLVGTFYRSAAPDSPAFVEVGTKVDKGGTLCILEAMKMMNKFEADYSLEVLNILVENGQMCEYGTPLFEVRKI